MKPLQAWSWFHTKMYGHAPRPWKPGERIKVLLMVIALGVALGVTMNTLGWGERFAEIGATGYFGATPISAPASALPPAPDNPLPATPTPGRPVPGNGGIVTGNSYPTPAAPGGGWVKPNQP